MVDDDREDGSFWAELERAGECLPGIDLLQAGGKEDIAAADGDPDGGVVPVRASHIRATNGDYDEQTDCERKGDRQRSEGSGVVLHVDIDSFYCEVERMDEPGLRGKPLAVQQFNSGGFVAVSYEAKAAGVRKGDGVGAGGRSNIQSLKDSGAVSAEEARRRCPGLVVRPMRTERYREVSLAVHQLLRQWANGAEVEKASYDDFYLELRPDSPAVASHQLSSPGSYSVHFVGVSSVSDLPPRLQFAVRAAVSIQSAIRELGLSASVGVSHNKLLSRLLSPLNKPAAVTVIQPSAALPFLHSQRIRAIPGLQRKAGQGIVAALGIETVAGVAGFSEAQLRATIGAPHAELLLDLFRGSLRHAVKERGPPKSIIAER
jgi:nucleotidyltransferase/DNA polymerase involved in DNA repair